MITSANATRSATATMAGQGRRSWAVSATPSTISTNGTTRVTTPGHAHVGGPLGPPPALHQLEVVLSFYLSPTCRIVVSRLAAEGHAPGRPTELNRSDCPQVRPAGAPTRTASVLETRLRRTRRPEVLAVAVLIGATLWPMQPPASRTANRRPSPRSPTWPARARGGRRPSRPPGPPRRSAVAPAPG